MQILRHYLLAMDSGVAFSPDGANIAVAHTTTPVISVYPWSSGFGTKYANPATLPANVGYWGSL
jgi:hypothetical protein